MDTTSLPLRTSVKRSFSMCTTSVRSPMGKVRVTVSPGATEADLAVPAVPFDPPVSVVQTAAGLLWRRPVREPHFQGSTPALS